MELYLLCLPISYEEISSFLYGKNESSIDDFKTENNMFLEDTPKNEDETNKIHEFEYTKGKRKINDVVYSITPSVTQTDLCCWWCCHTFEGQPLGYPMKYIDTTNTFVCRGVFCGFSCALSYGIKEKGKHNANLLNLLYRNVYEIKWTQSVNIQKAGPKEVLKKFGGPLDIKDYRDTQCKQKFLLYKMPIIYMNEQIHLEIEHGETKTNNVSSRKNKLNDHAIKQSKARLLLESKENVNDKNTISEKLKNSKKTVLSLPLS